MTTYERVSIENFNLLLLITSKRGGTSKITTGTLN